MKEGGKAKESEYIRLVRLWSRGPLQSKEAARHDLCIPIIMPLSCFLRLHVVAERSSRYRVHDPLGTHDYSSALELWSTYTPSESLLAPPLLWTIRAVQDYKGTFSLVTTHSTSSTHLLLLLLGRHFSLFFLMKQQNVC